MNNASIASTDWLCNSNEAIEIQLLQPNYKERFSPSFTYPIFGEHEQIYGFKNLKIKLYYASGSLSTYFNVSYDQKITEITPAAQPDDVMGKIKEFIPNDFITNYDTFLNIVESDSLNFRPMGKKIGEYHIRRNDEVDDTKYEIYKTNFSTPKFKEFHRRLQIFALFCIEGASYIDEDDEKWEIALLFEKKNTSGTQIYNFVGYCTMYAYFYCTRGKLTSVERSLPQNSTLPHDIRMRISQFLILPPYQSQGHGNKLYQSLYQNFLANSLIKEITVEDPNEPFQDLRDKNDLRYLIDSKLLENIQLPVDKQTVEKIRHKCKLNERQMARCLEIYLLRKLNKTNENSYKNYRLHVKKRLFRHNEDTLNQLSKEERLQKLEETYRGVEDDYQRILLLL
ncbi:8273_t:CDS:1 [Ambispora leptoticha]|uniref:Histone acetyltransferase type B catalytic subunit n=1 Tax=Ambispora leptoticha TaxID=144679 RepID=A0A9N9HLE7_9GLOM|nr:8273_t:CDS:1 [Ambispora leptoticha]